MPRLNRGMVLPRCVPDCMYRSRNGILNQVGQAHKEELVRMRNETNQNRPDKICIIPELVWQSG
jgi:hypothetical protein